MKRVLILCLWLTLTFCLFAQFTDSSASLPVIYNGATVWGDYDHDGDLDLLLSGQTAATTYISRVYRNDGGTFTNINAGLTGVYFCSAAWGDYDNDGDLDILLAGYTGSIYITKIYRNDNGVFNDIGVGLPGVYYCSAAWGDYDNDGDLDILLSGNTGSTNVTQIYRNTNGVFSNIGANLIPVYRSSSAWGDYDNDGDLDILLNGYTGSSYVSKLYRNDGSGGFTDTGAPLTGVQYGSCAWGDYDGDGDLDILITGQSGSTTYVTQVYRNNGGSFSNIATTMPGILYGKGIWGDFDNDGDQDILLSGYMSTSPYYISRIYRNDGGTFTDLNAGLTGLNRSAAAWGDYDNDGDLDAILSGITAIVGYSILYRNDYNIANTVPTAPAGLAADRGSSFITFSWDAASDSQTVSAGLSYALRIGTTPGGNQISNAMANSSGHRFLAARGNVNNNHNWRISSAQLANQAQYYWSVQAVDGVLAGSAFASEQTFQPIKVLTPNGGQNWLVNSEQTITWEAIPGLSLNIYLSTDNGSSWTQLNSVAVAGDLGYFNFTVPSTPSAMCLVKVENAAASAAFDASDAVFTLSLPPSLELTAPTLARMAAGSEHAINWTAVNVQDVVLSYSLNGGTDWTAIDTLAAEAGTFNWTVPNSPSNQCLLRVSDQSNPTLFDDSNSYFSICTLALTSPEGGEIWGGLTTHNITWTQDYMENLDLEYSPDNGFSWVPIADSINAAALNYAWEVPNTFSAQYLVRVTAQDDPSIRSVSGSAFTVRPQLTVTAPNGGEVLEPNTSCNVLWSNTPEVDAIVIEYSIDNGANWLPVTDNPISSSLESFIWTTPVNPSPNCLIRISRSDNTGIYDISDNTFTLLEQPSISLADLSRSRLNIGSSYSINWTSVRVNTIKLEFSPDNGSTWALLDTLAASTSIYNWTVAETPSDQCLLRLSDFANPSFNDNSGSVFSICSLQIVSPNGGETFQTGSNLDITWNSHYVPLHHLEYSADNGLNWAVIADSVSGSSFTWTVPETTSSAYLVRVSDSEYSDITDASDSLFATAALVLTQPTAAGIKVQNGREYAITWSSENLGGTLALAISYDDGANWTSILNGLDTMLGTLTVTVNDPPATQVRLRLTSDQHPGISSTSTNPFVICSLQLTSPNGGEIWGYDTPHYITWTAVNTGPLNFELSPNGGSTWSYIGYSIGAESGSMLLPGTYPISEDYLIRVSDAANPEISSQSASTWAIRDQLNLLTPDGGEILEPNTAYDITWEYTAEVDSIMLSYSPDEGYHWLPITTEPYPVASGVYQWTTPNVGAARCFVRISRSDGGFTDRSNGWFTILEPRSITMIAPTRTKLQMGKEYAISWTAVRVDTVAIDLSYNGGQSWMNLATLAAADGTFNWTVSNPSSEQYLLRVYDVANPLVDAVSLTTFTICRLQLVSPVGGEWFQTGSEQNVTWSSEFVSLHKLEYSSDAGQNWNTIADSLSGSSYAWTIPAPATSNYLVRISDTDDSEISHTLINTFATASLLLTQPSAAGIKVQNGREYSLAWTSANLEGTLNLEISYNDGADWNFITSGVELAPGSLTVTVNDQPTTGGRIRISSTQHPEISSASANSFTIADLALTSPVGGEVWGSQAQHNIGWTAGAIGFLTLEYSSDNGFFWNTIADSVDANLGSYPWTLPATYSENYLVRIKDRSDSAIYSTSAAAFAVRPQITVNTPNGGEILEPNASYNITWTNTSEVTNVLIDYSVDNGSNWLPVITEPYPAAGGTYDWTTPNNPSTTCLMRVKRADDDSIFDVSDNTFTLLVQPSIELTGPTNSKLQVSRVYAITWNAVRVNTVKIEYSTDNGQNWTFIDSVAAVAGAYNWAVPHTTSDLCLLRVSDNSNPSVTDTGDIFTILWIHVTSPNGGEMYQTGSEQTITWQSEFISLYKLQYTTDGGHSWSILADGVTGSSYAWTLPPTASSQYLVWITDSTDSDISDLSDGFFATSTLNLTTPGSSGIKLQTGDEYDITWNSANLGGTLALDYSTDAGLSWISIATDVNIYDAQYSWTVPDTVSTSCLVRLTSEDYNGISSRSTSFFTISRLMLTSPLGGEIWSFDSYHFITWTAANVDFLAIEYSTDGGEAWNPITIGINAQTSQVIWHVPAVNSTNCLVRLTDIDHNDISSVSTAFTIRRQINILSPNGYEQIDANIDYPITWSALDVSAIQILYTVDDGDNWLPITTEPVSAAAGSFTWHTPNDPSIHCLVRINAEGNPAVNDISDYWFTLLPCLPVVDFSADVTEGMQPFTVQFTDLSDPVSGSISARQWQFGDGETSNLQNPVHTYQTWGTFNVTLRVTNSYGMSNVLVKTAYIRVLERIQTIELQTVAPVSFGNVIIGLTSQEREVDILNTGNVPVSIDSLSFSGPGSPFAYQGSFQPLQVNPGSHVFLPVVFNPSAYGSVTDTLCIYNSSINLPVARIVLNGTGRYGTPLPPDSLLITNQGYDFIVSWNAVTQTVEGTAITPDYYIIFYDGLPDADAPYYYLGWTDELSYVHERVGLHARNMFYQVIAYKQDAARRDDLRSRMVPGMTKAEVLSILNSK